MIKVHLDTDLGGDIDDLCALAMLLKWQGVQIGGITVVGDDKGTRTGFTKYSLKIAGREDIPVKAGADISLGCYRIHLGYQGEKYWPQDLLRENNKVDEALDLLKRSIDEGSIIIGIGPLTNFYLLDRKYPGILKEAKLFLMGGYIFPPRNGYPKIGNNNDFNIQVDINSSKYILENSQPTLIPLTVTIETYIRRAFLTKLEKADELCKLIAKQADIFDRVDEFARKNKVYTKKLPKDIINFLHDPLTVAIALGFRDGVTIEDLPLRFEVKDTWMNEIIDKANPQKTLKVVTGIDGDKFSKFWLEMVTSH